MDILSFKMFDTHQIFGLQEEDERVKKLLATNGLKFDNKDIRVTPNNAEKR